MAVTVVINEGAAIAPGFSSTCDAGFFADVREGAVAIVAIQNIFSVVGDEQVFVTVIVIIADADALAPSGVGEAGFLRDVGERAVVIVVVKMARGRLACGKTVERGAVHDEDVWPAVVVV